VGEYDHPSYGADGYTVECASFAELREHVDASDKDLNRIYRRDWFDHTQPYADDLHLDGEDRSTQTFIVYAVMPRTERCVSWSCPISHDQEAEVLAWLRRPAGARRAPDAVGTAPRRNGGSAVSAAEPYAAVIPRRYSVAGHVATPPRGPWTGRSRSPCSRTRCRRRPAMSPERNQFLDDLIVTLIENFRTLTWFRTEDYDCPTKGRSPRPSSTTRARDTRSPGTP
jgi:hypothetical protein